MEKKRPEVIIESAEPISSDGSQSDSNEEDSPIQKRPTRLNVFSSGIAGGAIPRGMMPANRLLDDRETESEEEGEVPNYQNRRFNLSLNHPLVLVAASIGIGLLIGYFGTEMMKPAVEKVVEAAEEIMEENN